MIKYLIYALVWIAASIGIAVAAEEIKNFDVKVTVEKTGDIIVVETITITAEGNQINRGIFRDLPRYYLIDNNRFKTDYHVTSVIRDGKSEPYEISSEGNAMRIRIGDPDVRLSYGDHIYQLTYEVKNQIRYFDTYDELYWNVTGNYWAFPINQARVEVTFPSGAQQVNISAYTGALGEAGEDYRASRNGDAFVFEATRPLTSSEGMTVAIGIQKGLIDPLSEADKTALWWQRYGALGLLLASLLGVLVFYYRAFDRVGRDPAKPPVFPRYEPPRGYSPAAIHYIYYRAVAGHKALIATLMNQAVKGGMTIDASQKSATVLTLKKMREGAAQLAPEDAALQKSIFSGGQKIVLGDSYNTTFTDAYTAFQSSLSKKYGKDYFQWNTGYVVVAVLLSILAIIIATTQVISWTWWHTFGVLALVILNGWFMYLMPAPTPKGQSLRSEIEGFKLYLETAEKLQLNAVKVGVDAPPMMTVERYEKFLPYAVALGVEKPWTKHFEKLIPQEAANYNPSWTTMNPKSFGSMDNVTKSLVSNMSSGVTGALPQQSSSSGSSGGGSSGGGGGGGGGGGW